MRSNFRAVILLPAVFAAAALAANPSFSLVASAAQASGIAQVMAPEFAGFGIEPSNLFSYTGAASTNDFSVNLMQNLASYSGKPGHIRLGGNTQDYFLYKADMNDWKVATNPNSKGQGAIASDADIVGPRFFQAISRFPKGTPITFGLNLAYNLDDYLDQISLMASAALNNLSNVDLVSFEIGNEPDLYAQNGFRTGSWSGTTYVNEWKTRAQAVWERVLSPAGGWSPKSFEGPCTASTIGTTFEINQLVSNGVQQKVAGASDDFLATWNQHDYLYFIDVSTTPLTLDWVMNLDNTVSQFTYWKQQIKIALEKGIPYNLREMQSVGPTGAHGVSDTLGAGIWGLNFFLYAASLNVSSVQMHMTDNSYAAPWQPITRKGQGPNVRPVYYAYAAVAQLIGSGNGTTRIAPVSASNLDSAYSPYVRAYAGYANGQLSSLTVINNKMANSSVANKGSLTFTANFPNAKGKTLYLSYLTGPGAESTSNTTFNGISYETSGNGQPTKVSDAQTVTIDGNGKATFTVRDSEAVIANVGFQLGSRSVSSASGSETPNTSSGGRSGEPSTTTAMIAATATGLALTMTGGAAEPTGKVTSAAVAMVAKGWVSRRTLGASAMALCAVVACLAGW
ncbi:hypothetical protein IWX49DRAFT_382120 [Phyllosticta citricarpa]|uniref:Beta-glucuronidase C-terminal domain-containing protein n=1 Tax=Phyllosticta citricarpa TaxID=55181 RepID=A0ABR1L5G3_9PEZI